METGERISSGSSEPLDHERLSPGAEVEHGAIPVEEEAARPARRSGVRIVLGLAALILIIVLGAWFFRYQTTGRYLQSTEDAYIQADAVIVSPRVSGYVDRVFVVDNQQVEVGTPLVAIDAREYRAQAAQATAGIDVASANANAIGAQISEQRSAIEGARAQLQGATTDLAFARAEVTRYEPLAASGAEPRERLSQLRNQVRSAEAEVGGARAALSSAQRRIGSLQSQVTQARAQGEASQAQLEAVSVNVGATLLRAGIAGRIGSKSVQTGQFVQAGTRMMSIVPVTKLYIDANFKETQIGLMRVGQPVTIEVDALDGIELHGRVESFAPGTGAQFSIIPPENATGNFTKIVQRIPVRISIDAAPSVRALLLPGMSVGVTVDTRSAKGDVERIEAAQERRPAPAPVASSAAANSTGAQAPR